MRGFCLNSGIDMGEGGWISSSDSPVSPYFVSTQNPTRDSLLCANRMSPR
jgi:hypothetical protein